MAQAWAKKFYNSKEWRALRARLVVEANFRCAHCGEEYLKEKRKEDILLLDIRMDEISGMEVAKKLREEDNDVLIIFITSETQYSLEGYRVHAFGFLPKPISYPVFRNVMNEALAYLKKKKGNLLSVKCLSGIISIKSRDILYFSVYGHEVSIFLKGNRSERCALTLSECEKEFSSFDFFRCHNSYLVNLENISSIRQSTILLKNNEEIPLSRHRRKELLQRFTRYMGENIL